MFLRKTLLSAVALAASMMAASGGEAVSRITLDEAIITARAQSVDAAVALNELKTAYWQYRTFRADLLPEVNFQATVPSYRKNYSTYQLTLLYKSPSPRHIAG